MCGWVRGSGVCFLSHVESQRLHACVCVREGLIEKFWRRWKQSSDVTLDISQIKSRFDGRVSWRQKVCRTASLSLCPGARLEIRVDEAVPGSVLKGFHLPEAERVCVGPSRRCEGYPAAPAPHFSLSSHHRRARFTPIKPAADTPTSVLSPDDLVKNPSHPWALWGKMLCMKTLFCYCERTFWIFCFTIYFWINDAYLNISFLFVW